MISSFLVFSFHSELHIQWTSNWFAFCSNSTSVCVQKAFHRLKTSKVPNWTMLSYGGLSCSKIHYIHLSPELRLQVLIHLPLLSEIIDFLQREVVPRLKDKLKTLSSEQLQPETQQGGVYRLSEIFSENEDNFTEVDNSVS